MRCYTEKTGLGKETMSDDQQILIDSDAFIGLTHKTDALHKQAIVIYKQLKQKQVQFTTTSAVVSEIVTLLSHRQGHLAACKFLETFVDSGQVPVIFVNEPLYQQGLHLFKQQTKKGTSFTDCANAAVCRQLDLTHIFSFDRVYPKSFGIALVAPAA
jgi:predicted nucleic acid-binding protein